MGKERKWSGCNLWPKSRNSEGVHLSVFKNRESFPLLFSHCQVHFFEFTESATPFMAGICPKFMLPEQTQPVTSICFHHLSKAVFLSCKSIYFKREIALLSALVHRCACVAPSLLLLFPPWLSKVPPSCQYFSLLYCKYLTPVFLPGEFRGQRSLVGYSPWAHKELDMAERLIHVHVVKYHLLPSFFLKTFFLFGLPPSTCSKYSSPTNRTRLNQVTNSKGLYIFLWYCML